MFKKAGIEVTSENRKKIDRIIHDTVNVKYPNCPAAWNEVKKRVAENEDGFARALKEAWKSQS